MHRLRCSLFLKRFTRNTGFFDRVPFVDCRLEHVATNTYAVCTSSSNRGCGNHHGETEMFEKLYVAYRIVEDQDEAVAFYTEKLGFEIKQDNPAFGASNERYVTVGPLGDKNTELALFSLNLFEETIGEQSKQIIGRNPHLTYEVDNCQETYDELRERGVEFSEQPEEMPFGIYAIATDPEGNEINLLESPGMGES